MPTLDERLAEIDDLHRRGVITAAEHHSARQQAISEHVHNQGQPAPASQGSPTGGTPCRCGETLGTVTFQLNSGNKLPPACTVCNIRFNNGDVLHVCQKCSLSVCTQCAVTKAHLTVYPRPYTGLCDCSQDCSSFFASIFCFYCMMAKMGQGFMGFTQRPSDVDPSPGIPVGCTGSVCCNVAQLMFCDLLCLFQHSCLTVCTYRLVMKQRYFLVEETGCDACCKALFCRWCLLAANYREATARGHFPGGVACARTPKRSLLEMKPPCPPVNLEQMHHS